MPLTCLSELNCGAVRPYSTTSSWPLRSADTIASLLLKYWTISVWNFGAPRKKPLFAVSVAYWFVT